MDRLIARHVRERVPRHRTHGTAVHCHILDLVSHRIIRGDAEGLIRIVIHDDRPRG